MNYIQKAIEIAGSQAKLASRIVVWHSGRDCCCTLTQQGVSKWLEVPPEHCRAIEEITHGEVTRYDLRPDVFGEAPGCDCSETREAA